MAGNITQLQGPYVSESALHTEIHRYTSITLGETLQWKHRTIELNKKKKKKAVMKEKKQS